MRVCVLKGGRSLEREVSLRSGARVEDALKRLGHEVEPIDVGAGLVRRIGEARPEVAFVALHGVGGEDGTVQELLEILDVPFTGSGVAACGRCMDKVVAKHELRAESVPTPDWFAFNSTAFRDLGAGDALGELQRRLGFPLMVKPARGGSSLGVRRVADAAGMPAALISAFSYDDRVLLERFVEGRELAVGIVGSEPLPVVEVIPGGAAGGRDGGYDYEARYQIGRTEFACPARLGEAEAEAVTAAARGAYEALGCSGFSRVDLLLGENGPEVLEVNAIPGLTDTSLLPQAAEAAGMSFEELIERILALAMERAGSSSTADAV